MAKNNFLFLFCLYSILILSGCTPGQYPNIFGYPQRPYQQPQVLPPTNRGPQVYYVQPGDTLGSISQRFTGFTKYWPYIAQYNNITDPRRLYVGQKIIIPPSILQAARYEGGQHQIAGRATSPKARQHPKKQPSKAASKPAASTAAPKTLSGGNAQDDIKGWITVAGDKAVEVRAEPDPFSSVIVSLQPGDRVPWFDKRKQWYKVFTKEGDGYLHEEFVKEGTKKNETKDVVENRSHGKKKGDISGASANTSAASTEKQATEKPPMEKSKGLLKITGSNKVKIYSAPNPFSSVVKSVYPGTVYNWYQKDEEGWYKIQTSKGPGWVYEEYVKMAK